MILKPSPVSSSYFTWHRDENLLVAEASDLPGGLQLGRVYDDAADVGLTVISAATGKECVFVLANETRDRENDLVSWEFVLAPESARQARLDGRSGDVRVRIYND